MKQVAKKNTLKQQKVKLAAVNKIKNTWAETNQLKTKFKKFR